MAKRISQLEHDRIVKDIANLLIEKNYSDVKADLPDFEKPAKITWKKSHEGHIPDISGQKEGLKIFEVETSDSIDDQHTKDQWTLFGKHATENDMTFWVVVPQRSVPAANQRLKELDIKANVWGV